MRLLIAEDDPRLLKSLKYIFEKNHYVTDATDNGTDALAYAETEEYDGLVLDIMMPGIDGIELIKILRKKGIRTPALFLSARTEVEQRVEGLDAGADDYLPKPFSSQELLARVRAMLRRKEHYTPDLMSVKGLSLNRSTYELAYQGKVQALRGKEFQIMEYFMQQPDCVVTSEQIISHIWQWDSEVDVSVVWVHISNLRKKISLLGAPFHIRFIRNAGYTLEEYHDLSS